MDKPPQTEQRAERTLDRNAEALDRYRETLIEAEGKAQGEYDRLIVALSGGALGVSFAFVDQFIGTGAPQRVSSLIAAWTCWVSSLAFILASHYFSVLAMREAIRQVDSGVINEQQPGGRFDSVLQWLNAFAGLFFLAGATLAGVFVFANVR